jgi:AraC family transcriptional regulator, exoenzyme S synthesis regulatory protein ExsA
MKQFSLPEDLTANHDKIYESIEIRSYNSHEVRGKSKVTLNRNLFSFLKAGIKTVSYAEKHIQIDNTQFLLLSAGNCLMSERIAAEKVGYQSTMLFFDNAVLANFFFKYSHLLIPSNQTTAEEPFIVFTKDDFLNNFISSLDLIISSGTEISLEMKHLKFEELMVYLCGKYPEQIIRLRTSAHETREDFEIRKAVESNLANNITVEELAFLCNTSLSTFKRRFTKIYGSSPNKWMLQKRMEMAASLLIHSNEKPREVYYKVGYENLSSFIESFKQAYGVTPKEYQTQKLNA